MARDVYEKYQENLYSLSACSNDYNEDKMQESKLLMDSLAHIGVAPCKAHHSPKVPPIKLHKH
jgi:hypothetical protein